WEVSISRIILRAEKQRVGARVPEAIPEEIADRRENSGSGFAIPRRFENQTAIGPGKRRRWSHPNCDDSARLFGIEQRNALPWSQDLFFSFAMSAIGDDFFENGIPCLLNSIDACLQAHVPRIEGRDLRTRRVKAVVDLKKLHLRSAEPYFARMLKRQGNIAVESSSARAGQRSQKWRAVASENLAKLERCLGRVPRLEEKIPGGNLSGGVPNAR